MLAVARVTISVGVAAAILLTATVAMGAQESAVFPYPQSTEIHYITKKPIDLHVYDISFAPKCDQNVDLHINTEGDTINIWASCQADNITINFLAPATNHDSETLIVSRQVQNTWREVPARAVAITTDDRYYKVEAHPDALGAFSFSEELKAEQTQWGEITSISFLDSIKMLDMGSIKKRDNDVYTRITEFLNPLVGEIQKQYDELQNRLNSILRGVGLFQ